MNKKKILKRPVFSFSIARASETVEYEVHKVLCNLSSELSIHLRISQRQDARDPQYSEKKRRFCAYFSFAMPQIDFAAIMTAAGAANATK